MSPEQLAQLHQHLMALGYRISGITLDLFEPDRRGSALLSDGRELWFELNGAGAVESRWIQERRARER